MVVHLCPQEPSRSISFRSCVARNSTWFVLLFPDVIWLCTLSFCRYAAIQDRRCIAATRRDIYARIQSFSFPHLIFSLWLCRYKIDLDVCRHSRPTLCSCHRSNLNHCEIWLPRRQIVLFDFILSPNAVVVLARNSFSHGVLFWHRTAWIFGSYNPSK